MPAPHERNSERKGEGKVATERRRELRVTSGGALRCDHGRVLDVSMHGMRVLSTRRWDENAVHRVCLESDRRLLILDARCTWCRQEGAHDHQVGLEFGSLNEDQVAVLELLLDDVGIALL